MMLITVTKKLLYLLKLILISNLAFAQPGLEPSPIASTYNVLQDINEDSLIKKLEHAIENEPDNGVHYVALGEVHHQVFKKTFTSGDLELAETQFQIALKNYTRGIELKKGNIDNTGAIYAAGNLYHTKATLLAQLMDASIGTKTPMELKLLKDEYLACFNKALPYFCKLESLQPNDPSILKTLKEIFVHKDELVLAEEFTNRLKVLQNGGQNERPYF